MHAFLIALASTVIVNAQIADGTGAPLRRANVRITDDRIAADRRLSSPRGASTVVDAKGLVLAPGFIDVHNHSEDGLDRDPLATTQIAQGITTMLLGADGGSPWPIGPWLEERAAQPCFGEPRCLGRTRDCSSSRSCRRISGASPGRPRSRPWRSSSNKA